jgi:hypothetical protein
VAAKQTERNGESTIKVRKKERKKKETSLKRNLSKKEKDKAYVKRTDIGHQSKTGKEITKTRKE